MRTGDEDKPNIEVKGEAMSNEFTFGDLTMFLECAWSGNNYKPPCDHPLCREHRNGKCLEARAVVLARLADYARLKAENEKLQENAMRDYAAHLELKARAEKAEADLAQLQSACYDGCATGDSVFDELKWTTKERDTLKTALARFKPLIEAAGKIGGTVAVEIWDWLHSESAICPPWVNTENSRAVRAVLAAIPEAEKREEEPGYPRIVLIDCPVCGFRQRAGVHFYFGDPLPSYGHECCQCGHEIGESEWNESAEKRGNK